MNNEKYQQHLYDLIAFYCQYDNTIAENEMNIEIRVAPNIYDAILECDLTNKEKNTFNEQKESVKEHSGHILYPNEVRENFIIFISSGQFEKELLYVMTLFHELTHLIDFYNFSNTYCNGSYNDIESKKEFPMFFYWTEYHAKKVSYQLYRKYLNDIVKMDMSSDEIITHMKTTEVEYQNNNLLNQLNDNSNDFTQQMYFSLHYLARYNVWEEIDYEYFKEGKQFPYWLDITFNGKIIELYNLMKRMSDFNSAKENFIELEKMLKFLAKVD